MPRGSKPGERRGGRQKGQPNRKNAETIAVAEASGLLPHEILLRVARSEYERAHEPGLAPDDRKDALNRAVDASGKAAPFYAPKLASVEQKHSGEMTVHNGVDRPPRETRDEWIARRQREASDHVGSAARAASGSH